MNGITENDNGWVNDDILVDEIIKTLDSTKGPDFTFGITVQSHGKYDVATDKVYPLSVTGAPEGMEQQYTYYVNQIAEVDSMVGRLIEELSRRDEDTMLVLYGDHLPSLEIEAGQLKNGDLYQTQYVTWNNFGLKNKDKKDLASYQLYPYIFDLLGIHEGIITKYHQQSEWDSESYLDGLTMLSYDLLYGDNYAYNGIVPFTASVLQMGTDKISIKDVEKTRDGYIVKGTGFTPYSEVYFDGDNLDTEWIDERHLKVTEELDFEEEEEEPEGQQNEDIQEDLYDEVPDAFVVKVKDDDGVTLSVCKPVLYRNTSLFHEIAGFMGMGQ